MLWCGDYDEEFELECEEMCWTPWERKQGAAMAF
jgi:hypothetical protein